MPLPEVVSVPPAGQGEELLHAGAPSATARVVRMGERGGTSAEEVVSMVRTNNILDCGASPRAHPGPLEGRRVGLAEGANSHLPPGSKKILTHLRPPPTHSVARRRRNKISSTVVFIQSPNLRTRCTQYITHALRPTQYTVHQYYTVHAGLRVPPCRGCSKSQSSHARPQSFIASPSQL